jgi:hypothetical protein
MMKTLAAYVVPPNHVAMITGVKSICFDVSGTTRMTYINDDYDEIIIKNIDRSAAIFDLIETIKQAIAKATDN